MRACLQDIQQAISSRKLGLLWTEFTICIQIRKQVETANRPTQRGLPPLFFVRGEVCRAIIVVVIDNRTKPQQGLMLWQLAGCYTQLFEGKFSEVVLQ